MEKNHQNPLIFFCDYVSLPCKSPYIHKYQWIHFVFWILVWIGEEERFYQMVDFKWTFAKQSDITPIYITLELYHFSSQASKSTFAPSNSYLLQSNPQQFHSFTYLHWIWILYFTFNKISHLFHYFIFYMEAFGRKWVNS